MRIADQLGSFTAALVAVDPAGAETVVVEWSFDVVAKPPFEISSLVRFQGQQETSGNWLERTQAQAILEPVQNSLYSTNTLYRFGAVDLSSSTIHNPSGGIGSITFTTENAPPGFFLDPLTGEIQGLASRPGEYAMQVFGLNGSNAKALAQTIHMAFDDNDSVNSSNGPRGRGCLNGGAIVDAVPFNDEFGCDCSGSSFTGTNCGEARPCLNGVFINGACSRFEPAFRSSRVLQPPEDMSMYLFSGGNANVPQRNGSEILAVGVTFRIAPLELDLEATNFSRGHQRHTLFACECPSGLFH